MITIRIDNNQQEVTSGIPESWINQQINRRKADGLDVCVTITIKQGPLDMLLSTPACHSGATGRRPPNEHEQHVLDLWQKHHLTASDFSGGNVVAFLKELPR